MSDGIFTRARIGIAAALASMMQKPAAVAVPQLSTKIVQLPGNRDARRDRSAGTERPAGTKLARMAKEHRIGLGQPQ